MEILDDQTIEKSSEIIPIEEHIIKYDEHISNNNEPVVRNVKIKQLKLSLLNTICAYKEEYQNEANSSCIESATLDSEFHILMFKGDEKILDELKNVIKSKKTF